MSLEVFCRPDASQPLSVAVNLDFGRLESDELVVNFSAFETFYAERRPFFAENQALFDVSGGGGLRMLHTRRMGTAGDIRAAVKYTRNGEQIDFRADITDTLGLEGQLISTRVDRQKLSDDDQCNDQCNDQCDDNRGGAWLSFEQEFNQNWHHSLSLTHYDKDFNINDLGYLARADLPVHQL